MGHRIVAGRSPFGAKIDSRRSPFGARIAVRRGRPSGQRSSLVGRPSGQKTDSSGSHLGAKDLICGRPSGQKIAQRGFCSCTGRVSGRSTKRDLRNDPEKQREGAVWMDRPKHYKSQAEHSTPWRLQASKLSLVLLRDKAASDRPTSDKGHTSVASIARVAKILC